MLVISVGFETGNIKIVTNATGHLIGAEPVCYPQSDSLSAFHAFCQEMPWHLL